MIGRIPVGLARAEAGVHRKGLGVLPLEDSVKRAKS